MPNLAIVGYGKMGRLIDQLAPEYGFTVTARVDIGRDEPLEGADVAVEFSVPSSVSGNVAKVAALRIPMVVGTTGWVEHLAEVKAIVAKHDSALVWSPNFSIGVNVFTRLVSEAARLLKNEKEYGAWAWEIHHITKKDAPSVRRRHPHLAPHRAQPRRFRARRFESGTMDYRAQGIFRI
jgi:4-hydroxy-tetrahydrodipicolinate reductase